MSTIHQMVDMLYKSGAAERECGFTQTDVATAAGAQSKDGGAEPTSMMRAFAVAKSSFSMAEVRVVYRRYSSHPAFNEMAVGLHLWTL